MNADLKIIGDLGVDNHFGRQQQGALAWNVAIRRSPARRPTIASSRVCDDTAHPSVTRHKPIVDQSGSFEERRCSGLLCYLRDARMSHRFESALSKIGRARAHADDLEAEISAFRSANPCEVEVVGTPLTDREHYRVKHMSAVPDSIPLIMGDAAHNLRSALDHFAWSAVSAQARGTRTYFPIWSKTPEPEPGKWRKHVSDQLKGASGELIQVVAQLEAWEAGRDWLLWAIHELDRIDKHRLLLSVAVVVTGIGLHGDSYELAVAKKYSAWT